MQSFYLDTSCLSSLGLSNDITGIGKLYGIWLPTFAVDDFSR